MKLFILWCLPIIVGSIQVLKFRSAHEGCPMDEHVQAKFCRADFVFKAVVKDDKHRHYRKTNKHSANTSEILIDDSAYISLPIFVRTQFKISTELAALSDASLSSILIRPDEQHLFAAKTPQQRFEKYILSGQLVTLANGEKRLLVGACDWIQTWSTVTQRQRSFLHKKLYDEGCATCSNDFCANAAPWQCYSTYSYCMPKGSKCVWSKNNELRFCQQRDTAS